MDWSLIYLVLAVGTIEVVRRLFSSYIPKADSTRTPWAWLLPGFSCGAISIMGGAAMVGAEKAIYGIAVVTVIGAFVLGYLSVANRWAGPLQSAFMFVSIWLILALVSLLGTFAGWPVMGAYIWWSATAVLFLVCLAGGYSAYRKFNNG